MTWIFVGELIMKMPVWHTLHIDRYCSIKFCGFRNVHTEVRGLQLRISVNR